MQRFNKLLISTLFLVIVGSFKAQFRQPQLLRLDKSKGIESNLIDDIVVDKEFKYWIASYNGLISYDGTNFTTYHMPFSQGNLLGSDMLYNLQFENDSVLWVTHIYGVAKFNIRSLTFTLIPIKGYPITTPLVFRSLFIDKEQNTFFCTMQSHFLKYDPKRDTIEDFLPLKNTMEDFILNVSELKEGYYLLQTQKGLQLFDPKSKITLKQEDTPANLQWIYSKELKGFVNDYEEIGEYRFISVLDVNRKYHVMKYNTLNGVFDSVPIISKTGRLLTKDSFGRLWLYGFRDQVEVYDLKANKVLALPDKAINTPDIDFSVAYQVFEDHEHNIWICTVNGLFTFNELQNSYQLLTKNTEKNYYTDVAELSPNQIWIGSSDKGIFEFNPQKGTFTNYDFFQKTKDVNYNEIKQILIQKKQQTVWLTGYKGRLIKYNRTKKTFSFYKDTSFIYTEICITENSLGEVFIGSYNGKIIKYNQNTHAFETLINLNDLKGISNNISIHALKHIVGDWFGVGTTEAGFIKVNLKTKEHEVFELDPKNPNSLRSNFITSLEKFDDARVFGGTLNGVFCYSFRTNKIENFSFNNDFSLGYVFDITQDKDQNLILIGANGMHLLNWDSKNIIDLGKRSNIDKVQLSGIYYSKSLDKVFISSEEDFYSLQLNPNNYTPNFKPIIYSVSSYDKTYMLGGRDEIVLDKHHNSFQIHFGSSTYIHREDIEYFYKLNDGDWIPVSSKYVGFSNLSGGVYHFKLKIVYKGNRKISSESLLKITIQKAYYEALWFYFLIAIIGSAIIYLIYRLRLRRLLAIEKVRFQLSRDLHDDMGSTLSTINILSAIAGDKLDSDPEKTRNYIGQISNNSQIMMESMDDIVWSINPANDDLIKIIYRMREFASGILEPKKIALLFYFSENLNDLKLSMEKRRDFFLLFKEAINNAAKYSECTKLKVSLFIHKKKLVLEIKDNGKGFEMKEYEDGNGLINMKKRAKLLKADFRIDSVLNEGTSIEVKLDLNKL